MRRAITLTLLILFAGSGTGNAQQTTERPAYDESVCGSLKNGYGPFDYRTQTREQRELVEGAHFTTQVENLEGKPMSDGGRKKLGDDLDYTLRVFPNHPRALFALTRLEEKERKVRPGGTRWPVPCYFERAIRFRADDGEVRMVFGIYLLRRGDKQGAIRELELANELLRDNANVNYNLGLAYFEVGKYDQALAQAKRARELGFDLAGLEKKLRQAGKWVD